MCSADLDYRHARLEFARVGSGQFGSRGNVPQVLVLGDGLCDAGGEVGEGDGVGGCEGGAVFVASLLGLSGWVGG